MCYTFMPPIMYYMPNPYIISELGIIPILYQIKFQITMVMNPR